MFMAEEDVVLDQVYMIDMQCASRDHVSRLEERVITLGTLDRVKLYY